jgi:hypothetical protein
LRGYRPDQTPHTVDGDTHLSGFRAALTRTMNDYGKRNGFLKPDETLAGENVRKGLTAIISVKLAEPQFEGQTKGKLGNAEVAGAVQRVWIPIPSRLRRVARSSGNREMGAGASPAITSPGAITATPPGRARWVATWAANLIVVTPTQGRKCGGAVASKRSAACGGGPSRRSRPVRSTREMPGFAASTSTSP